MGGVARPSTRKPPSPRSPSCATSRRPSVELHRPLRVRWSMGLPAGHQLIGHLLGWADDRSPLVAQARWHAVRPVAVPGDACRADPHRREDRRRPRSRPWLAVLAVDTLGVRAPQGGDAPRCRGGMVNTFVGAQRFRDRHRSVDAGVTACGAGRVGRGPPSATRSSL